MTSTNRPALLTPVPEIHLVEGLEVCRRRGKVAFGSQAWAVFDELDNIAGPGASVLIYASMTSRLGAPAIGWTGKYQQYVTSRAGSHPARARFRPASCKDEDASGYWAGFYEITDLRELPDDECFLIRSLRAKGGSSFNDEFIPRGPVILTG